MLSQPKSSAVKFGEIATNLGHRVVLYGTGGIGRTTLASFAPRPVAYPGGSNQEFTNQNQHYAHP